MLEMKKELLIFTTFGFAVLAGTPTAMAARQTSVVGGVVIRQGYDSNVNRTERNETEEWTTAVGPSLLIRSTGKRDALDLSYSPTYVYNHRTNDGYFDHSLKLKANRAISEKWEIAVNDTFEKSDDSTQGRNETVDNVNRVNLSENLARNRYWTNFAGVSSAWQYRQNSKLTLGYNNAIYDSDRPNQDYHRHDALFSLSHELNNQWQAEADYTFTKGDFDLYDSKQHSVDARLIYRLTPHASVYGDGNFRTTDYTGNRPGYHTAGGRLGYSRQIDSRTNIDLAAGISSTTRDGDSSTSAFSYSLALRRQFERGSFSIAGSGGFDDQQFNGENDGLSKFWSIKPVMLYQLAEKLSSSLYALYRNDKYIEQIPERDEDSFEAGGSLSWSFSRWYTAGIRYIYHQLDSNITNNSYDDHRLFLTLTASREFWKW